MRAASNDENLGIEIVNQFLGEMKHELQNQRGQRRFVDVAREGAPNFPWEDNAREEGDEEAEEAASSEGDEEEPDHEQPGEEEAERRSHESPLTRA